MYGLIRIGTRLQAVKLIVKQRKEADDFWFEDSRIGKIRLRPRKIDNELYAPVQSEVVYDHVVTNAGRDYIVDAFQNITELENFKYHDSGTGSVAEAAADTALGTPTGEARDIGTQIENGSGTYRTVATHTFAGAFTMREHGLFSASSAGTLLDRTVYAAIGVVSGDKIEFTFDITFSSGG